MNILSNKNTTIQIRPVYCKALTNSQIIGYFAALRIQMTWGHSI